jgi:hypothetical protein
MSDIGVYVLYHKDCPDGFGAAWAISKFWGAKATYLPLSHTDKLPEIPDGSFVIFADIARKRADLLALAARMHFVTILDHHKSAAADLANIEFEAPGHNIRCIFDMERSGAQIAWDFYHTLDARPKLLDNIADRDLWRFALPETKPIFAALITYPYDFEIWDSLMLEPLVRPGMITAGKALLRGHDIRVKELVREARTARFDHFFARYSFPAVNAPYFYASDVGNALLDAYPDAPFAAVYRDTATGRRDWSLRSTDERVDVSFVAQEFGGGGHRNAAGFSDHQAFDHMAAAFSFLPHGYADEK